MAACYWGAGQQPSWAREQSTRVRNNASSTQTRLSEGSVSPWKTSMTCPGEQASPSVGSEKQVKATSSRSNSLKKYSVSSPVKANKKQIGIGLPIRPGEVWQDMVQLALVRGLVWEALHTDHCWLQPTLSTETSRSQLLFALGFRQGRQLQTLLWSEITSPALSRASNKWQMIKQGPRFPSKDPQLPCSQLAQGTQLGGKRKERNWHEGKNQGARIPNTPCNRQRGHLRAKLRNAASATRQPVEYWAAPCCRRAVTRAEDVQHRQAKATEDL